MFNIQTLQRLKLKFKGDFVEVGKIKLIKGK